MTRKVLVFTKSDVPDEPPCMQCKYTKKVLEDLGVPYTELDVRTDQHAKELLEVNGYTSVPVVKVDIDAKRADVWAGFKIDKLRGLDPRDYT